MSRPTTAPPSSELRASPAVHTERPSQDRPSTPEAQTTPQRQREGTLPRSAYQRFVLTDPLAFRYLEEDPSTTVLERRRELHGYECYVVEQWTTSRTHPTFVVTTYTGDPSHIVIVGVLSVPTDESVWSPRLRVYFKALNQNHARRRETPLGILMVTNLSGFPSSLTLVAVPDGDLRKHRFDFFVNENLKRLGCSGRFGMILARPSPATAAKFHQLYRVSDKNDIYKSVIELVKLCQNALMLFEQLPADYADGLLCDVTERALSDWWREMGTEHYSMEPHDGILGPTTVAALLGLLMGARNRLHAVNSPVPKDPFDIDAMKQGIHAFQKQQRLPRSRRLDRRTLDRLHKASQKAADKEHWLVPKAVKSTVAELSGKGGEMVMDVVGRKDRAGIAEIETVDIERFAQLVYGDRCKWLWYGKPLKKSRDIFSTVSSEWHEVMHNTRDSPEKRDARDGQAAAPKNKGSGDDAEPDLERNQDVEDAPFASHVNDAEYHDETVGKGSMMKRAAHLKNEAKSGMSKVRDVVGFRGHRSRPSTDERDAASPEQNKGASRPTLQRAHTSPYASPSSVTSRDMTAFENGAVNEQSSRFNLAIDELNIPARRRGSAPSPDKDLQSSDHPSHFSNGEAEQSEDQSGIGGLHFQRLEPRHHSRDPSESRTEDTATPGHTNDEDSDGRQTVKWRNRPDDSTLLRRTVSFNPDTTSKDSRTLDAAFPRHLSFSLAEDSVLAMDLSGDDDMDGYQTLRMQLAEQDFIAQEAKQLRANIDVLHTEHAAWTQAQLRALDSLLSHAEHSQETLDALQFRDLESVQALQRQSEALLSDEQAALEEGSKGIETLVARLEYEIDGLRGKVEEVEAALGDFEKGVDRVEEHVVELEVAGQRGSQWGCIVC